MDFFFNFKSRNWKDLAKRKCVVCGKNFKPLHPQQITCGPICSMENKRAAQEAYHTQMLPRIKQKIRLGYYK